MNNQQVKFKIGGAVKVKGKTYFQFTKGGRFKHYQDYNFPVVACTPAHIKDEELIKEQRIQAILQRKPYSSLRETYFSSLIC